MVGPIGADVVLPAGALIAVVTLGIVEVGLAVFCIVDIVRRPAVLGDRKWLWIVLIVFFNLVGSIIYLAVGRVQPPLAESHEAPEVETRGRAQAAADMLCGPAGDRTPDTPRR
jgi:hypothetical protein